MTIDLTDRYNTSEYQRGGIDWTVDRSAEPVRALMIHHTAGFYGAALGVDATETEELAQLDALARDHAARFGIGPGYYYAAFPSGRLYAIGKYGTHRAHTRGKNPETQNWWNRESLAIVAFGNYQVDPVSPQLRVAMLRGVEEVVGILGGPTQLYGHREVPGNPTQTSCPGDNIIAMLDVARGDPNAVAIAEIEVAQAALTRALALLSQP